MARMPQRPLRSNHCHRPTSMAPWIGLRSHDASRLIVVFPYTSSHLAPLLCPESRLSKTQTAYKAFATLAHWLFPPTRDTFDTARFQDTAMRLERRIRRHRVVSGVLNPPQLAVSRRSLDVFPRFTVCLRGDSHCLALAIVSTPRRLVRGSTSQTPSNRFPLTSVTWVN